MHTHWILTKEELKARIEKYKEEFPACPICRVPFEYDEFFSAYNGPMGAIEVHLAGYYGSAKHDMESGSTYVCDDCGSILFALLVIGRSGPDDNGRAAALRDKLLPTILKAIGR